jgi:hypothetical protein
MEMKMKSLTQTINEYKIAKAHEQALVDNARFDEFHRSNRRSIDSMVSEIESGSIAPGETLLVNYVHGCPAFSATDTCRGKIVDINYGAGGYVILKTGFLRKKKIPLKEVESFEYEPETRERQRRLALDKANRSSISSLAMFEQNVSLNLPREIPFLDYASLSKLLGLASGDGYKLSFVHYANTYHVIGIEKNNQTIFSTGIVEKSYLSSPVRAYVLGCNRRRLAIKEDNPSAGISQIENNDARIFLSRLYEAMKEEVGCKNGKTK